MLQNAVAVAKFFLITLPEQPLSGDGFTIVELSQLVGTISSLKEVESILDLADKN